LNPIQAPRQDTVQESVTSSALPPSIYPVNHPTSSPITTVSAGAVNQDQGIWEDAVRSTEAPNQTFLELDDTTNSTNAPSQTPADGEISGKNTGAPSQIPVEAPVAEKWLTEAPAEDDKGKKKDKGDKRKDDNEDDRQDVSSAAGVVVVPVATLAPSQIPVEAPIVEKWLTEAPTEDDKENKKDKDNKENNEGNYKIEEITMEEYNKKLIENEKSGDKCIICAKIITSKYFYKCGHLTCNKCALRWIKIKKTCPICRIYLD